MDGNESWRITSISLFRKVININKTNYVFGSYELGKGGFGVVYPARRTTDGASVAIKVVSLAEGSSALPYLIDSFLNEIRQSKRLSAESRHVVKMFDFDFDSKGLAFIVMERGGLDLEKALIDLPTLSIYRQKILWKQILNILITLHNHALVHLDLKPSNLVFFGDRLKLVDLGIAQKANTRQRGPHGTYGFSAPEVHMVSYEGTSHATYKADIWSIGAILYWMNYGDAPKYNHYGGCHRPPPGVAPCPDANLVDILRHTLRMDFRRRPNPNWLARHPFTRSP